MVSLLVPGRSPLRADGVQGPETRLFWDSYPYANHHVSDAVMSLWFSHLIKNVSAIHFYPLIITSFQFFYPTVEVRYCLHTGFNALMLVSKDSHIIGLECRKEKDPLQSKRPDLFAMIKNQACFFRPTICAAIDRRKRSQGISARTYAMIGAISWEKSYGDIRKYMET